MFASLHNNRIFKNSRWPKITYKVSEREVYCSHFANCKNSNNLQPFTCRFFNMSYASGVMVVAVTQTGEPGYRYVQPC